jgi:cytochrome d ubiquinol oxidase subunit II
LFGLLVGLGLACGYALLGATWLVIKTDGELQAKALRWSKLALIGAALGVAAISLATPLASPRIMHKWFDWPRIAWLAPLPLLTAAACIGIWRCVGLLQSGRTRAEWLPFVLAVWCCFASPGWRIACSPYLVLDRLTVWQRRRPRNRCGSCSSRPGRPCCR